MRAARVLMNLGRASALATGPRRRGADREAWNRSRRTLLRAREAAERTGGELGDEALKLEAQMAARERTERDRGIPVGYEPGETPPAERPASYFVRDPKARAQLEAKERAEGGPDLDRAERAHQAYRQQMATVSRGYGAPAPQAAPAPGTESPWEPERMKRIAGESARSRLLARGVDPYGARGAPPPPFDPRVGRPPTEAEEAGVVGAAGPVPVAAGTIMPTGEESDPYLRGRYVGAPLTEAQQQAAAETQKRLQEGQDVAVAVQRQRALRAQMKAAGAPILPGPQTLGEILAQQAIVAAQQAEAAQAEAEAAAGAGIAPRAAEAGVAGAEAQARGMGAGATMLEAQALPAQQMLELWQTPEGKQQVMAMWGTASQQEKQAYAAQVLAEVGANLPPEIQQALAEAASGMRVEEYDGSWWQTGGVLGSVWDFLAGLVRGGPTMRRAVPVGPTAPAPMPAVPVAGAGPVAGAQAGAVIPGNVDTATASPEELVAIRDAAEAELQRRQRAGAR